MKTVMRVLCLYILVGFYVGCSPVKFDLDTAACEKTGQSCTVGANGKLHFDNTLNVGGGKVDILIVDDNSASMSFEQKALASRFSGFLSQLDAKSVDYRIGITTTDVTASGMGGKLVSFGSGVSYLTPSVSDRVTKFNNTIVRQETLQCENYIATAIQQNGMGYTNTAAYSQGYNANCPSGDERGVYAANLIVKNNPSSFIRSDAHLAIIFLSDEDERSQLYNTNEYALENYDQPKTLTDNIGVANGKSASIHAIVVKDNACLALQNDQTLGNPAVAATRGFVKGSLGNVYLTFPNAGWGKAVDICFNDYTSQLGDISTSILDKINRAPLACTSPSGLAVTLNTSDSSITWSQQAGEIVFSKQLPVGSTVRLVYDCDSI